MSREKEYSDVEARCIAETSQALLIQAELWKHWVPKSLVSEDSEVKAPGDEGTFAVETWFAEKEGLE